MRFLESLIMGLVSGFTEFLPISSSAHRVLIGTIFGSGIADPGRDLFIHIAILLAVWGSTARKRENLSRVYRNSVYRTQRTATNSNGVMEYRLIRLAAILFAVTFFLLYYFLPWKMSLIFTAIGLLINGFLIFLPDRALQGNKNANAMSTWDVILVGMASAFSVFPGLSRVGIVISVANLRGADKKISPNWALLLSVSALITWIVVDLFALIRGTGLPFWSNILYYTITAVCAYIGALVGISILRKHISKSGCAPYAYYCFGAAVFALILFLIAA